MKYTEQAVETLDDAASVIANKNIEIEQLRQRVAELESLIGQDLVSLNDELTRKYQKHAGDKYELQDKLAATQAHNLRLRSALEVATSICWSNFSEAQEVILTEALRAPTDTEALEKYVADRLGDPVAWREFDGEGNWDYCSYEDNETYRDDWIKRNPKPIYKDWVQPLYSLKEPK